MTDTVESLRAAALALWNANDAHPATDVTIELHVFPAMLGMPATSHYILHLVCSDDVPRGIPLEANPPLPKIKQWQLALDTLRKATDDMARRRNSALEENHRG